MFKKFVALSVFILILYAVTQPIIPKAVVEMPSLGFTLDDTMQFSAWGGSGGNFLGSRMFGSCNDCNNHAIQLLELTGLNIFGIGGTTAMNVANTMSSYGPVSGTCWDTPVSPPTFGCKSYDPWYWNGILYWNIVDFYQDPPYLAIKSAVIISPDNGSHWCNYLTYTTGGNVCNSGNWQANGDMPIDSSGIQWTGLTGSGDNPMGRLALVQVAQDNSISVPVIAGMDNANFIYFTSTGGVGLSYLHRFSKSCGDPMLPSCWSHWDNSIWNSNYLLSANIGIPGAGMSWSTLSHKFYTFGGDATTLIYGISSSIFGPWTTGTIDCTAIIGGCHGGFPTPILYSSQFSNTVPGEMLVVAADNTSSGGKGFFQSLNITGSNQIFPLPGGIK